MKSRQAIFLLSILPMICTGQSVKSISVSQSNRPIVIDGILSDEIWQYATVASEFERNFPDDRTHAQYSTEVKVTYDHEYLYIGAILFRNPEKRYSISSLKKDFVFYENDAFGLTLDTFGDFTNGYGFYVNAFGARRDEQISVGTFVDATLDINWKAEVTRSAESYTVELAIPFKYLRFSGEGSWNVNFVRNDMGTNERSSWVRTPINFLLGNLAFAGKLTFGSPITSENKLYSLIPSLTFSRENSTNEDNKLKLQPSLDAKVALSSSLNMDLTVNPDFSQAEVDQVQLNLTRFELAFPENRMFFIENSDLFSAFGDNTWGSPQNRPFYSRQIGLTYDSATSGYMPSPILGGIRVSGKLNKNLRVGSMSIFSRGNRASSENSPSQNVTVVAAQQKMFSRSNIAVMLVNRQSLENNSLRKFAFNSSDYNRVLALEYNFASPSDKISGKVYRHFMFGPANEHAEFSQGFVLKHNTSHWRNTLALTQITENYRPEVGFVPRNDVLGLALHAAYSVFPKTGRINQVETIVNPQLFLRSDGSYQDHMIISGFHLVSRKTQNFWLVHIQEQIRLKAQFDPLFNGEAKLDSGTLATFDYARLNYGSDKRQKTNWELTVDAGEYYQGHQFRAEGNFNYRLQPWTILGVTYNAGVFKLPPPFSSNQIYYVGPKVEISFTRNLFLTAVTQYSSLATNLTYYGRLQWRFKALSDLFVIYSANRDTNIKEFRNQNLVVKMVVWF